MDGIDIFEIYLKYFKNEKHLKNTWRETLGKVLRMYLRLYFHFRCRHYNKKQKIERTDQILINNIKCLLNIYMHVSYDELIIIISIIITYIIVYLRTTFEGTFETYEFVVFWFAASRFWYIVNL